MKHLKHRDRMCHAGRQEATMKQKQVRSARKKHPPAVTARAQTPSLDFFGLITADPGMERLFQIIRKAAQSDATVLLRGETGTGKELLAKALHQLSPRHLQGPFHAISCAALPASLLESEL